MIARTQTPPKGWNSFDCYGVYANERVLLENLEAFTKRLKPYGYEYFVLDAGWYRHFPIPEGEEFPSTYKSFDLDIDEFGRCVELRSLFPRGLKYIADRVHEAGCKFGIHIMRGIPRKAVRLNTPVKGTKYFAQDIANTEDVCPWNDDFYGINVDHPAGQAYYDSVVESLLEYDVDFIKADDLTPFPKEVEAIARAVEKAPRNIVLSLSPGNDVSRLNLASYNKSSMFRITSDVWDELSDLQKILDRWDLFADLRDPDCYIDMDMIPFGALKVYTSTEFTDENAQLLAGKGSRRMSRFSDDEKQFFITMLAVGASPLMFGGDLTLSDQYSIDLVTHPEVLACNNNNVCGTQVYFHSYIDVRQAVHRDNPGAGWIGIFNKRKINRHIRLTHEDLNVPANVRRLYSIWDDTYIEAGPDGFELYCRELSVVFLKYE